MSYPSSPPAPAAGRRERKRQQTADLLADRAWTLFSAHGFDAVTMEAIAEAADVAKGTLYKHFPVKEALLRHIFHRELAASLPALMAQLAALPTVAARLHGFLMHSATWSEQHREHLRHYVLHRLASAGAPQPQQAEDRSGMHTLFARFIAAGQASGELTSARDAAQLATYLQFMYLAALLRWLNHPALDLRAEFDAMLTLFLRGAGVTQ